MPANDVFELSVDATYNGQQVTNVMHAIQIGADGSGDARGALDRVWVDNFDVEQRTLQVTSVVHFQQRVRRILPTQTQTLITPNAGLGLATGNGLPTNQCAILRLYGAKALLKGVGHQKLYAVPVLMVLEGRVQTTFRDISLLYSVNFETNHTDPISGYVFRMGVLGTDSVLRQIQGTEQLGRIKQIHSRSIGVGQ